MHPQESQLALQSAVDELESELASVGWGQPTRLFGLVSSDLLLTSEPELAAEIGAEPGTLTAIEQDGFDTEIPVPQMLARIAWPEAVVGAAVAIEQLVLPPSAEAELATDADPEDVAAAAARDERATQLRIIVAVTRDGAEDALLVLEDHETPIRGGAGERLVPRLADTLAETFRPVDEGTAPAAETEAESADQTETEEQDS